MRGPKVVSMGDQRFLRFLRPDASGRMRPWLRCQFVFGPGPNNGKQCAFCRRMDSAVFTSKGGKHEHYPDIQAFFQVARSQPDGAYKELLEKYALFVAKSNMSLRAGASDTARDFIESAIRWGFAMGRSDPSQERREEFWNIRNRDQLRQCVLQVSDEIRLRKLKEFAGHEVSLSIDASTIGHQQVVDAILISHSYGGHCDKLLYREALMPNSSASTYREKLLSILYDLHDNFHINVNTIVGDGFSSQKTVIDDANRSSIQVAPDAPSFVRNIRFVYCRCHLVNLAVGDWIKSSESARACHGLLRRLSAILRKKKTRKELKAVCPEPVDTRFCYDYKIVLFIMRHIDKIRATIFVDNAIFGYGAILEVLWQLTGRFETNGGTLANTYEDITDALKALGDLAEKPPVNAFVRDNARLVSLILTRRLSEQYNLSCFAFSLTKRGRQYYRNLAGLDLPLGDRQQHGCIVREYLRFGVLDKATSSEESSSEEDFDDEQQATAEDIGNEEEQINYSDDATEEESWSDSDVDIQIQYNGELQRLILDQSKDALEFGKGNILDIGRRFLETWVERTGESQEVMAQLWAAYMSWLNEPLAPEIALTDMRDADLWQAVMFIPQLKAFASVARKVVTFPCSEALNERCFSLKKFIVGKHGIRSSADLVTARARLAMIDPKPRIE